MYWYMPLVTQCCFSWIGKWHYDQLSPACHPFCPVGIYTCVCICRTNYHFELFRMCRNPITFQGSTKYDFKAAASISMEHFGSVWWQAHCYDIDPKLYCILHTLINMFSPLVQCVPFLRFLYFYLFFSNPAVAHHTKTKIINLDCSFYDLFYFTQLFIHYIQVIKSHRSMSALRFNKEASYLLNSM